MRFDPAAENSIHYLGHLDGLKTALSVRETRNVLESIDLSSVKSNGYAFQIEMSFRAWKQGFRLVEIPIVFTDRVEGQSKMNKRIVREAIWMVWWLRTKSLAGHL